MVRKIPKSLIFGERRRAFHKAKQCTRQCFAICRGELLNKIGYSICQAISVHALNTISQMSTWVFIESLVKIRSTALLLVLEDSNTGVMRCFH